MESQHTINTKVKIGKAIAARRKELKMGQKEVCALIPDLKESALSNYERGRRLLPLEMAKKLADVLKTTPAIILALEAVANSESLAIEKTTQIGSVPLMAWSELADLDFRAPFREREGREHVFTTEPIESHTFALQLRDDSMEPKFPNGAIIIIEPMIEHMTGDYVIVCNGSNDATFRQIIQDGAYWFLKPENDRFPMRPLNSDALIIGVVTAMEMKLKRRR